MPVDASEYKKKQKALESKEEAKKVNKESQNKQASKFVGQPKKTDVKPDSYKKKAIDSLNQESIYIIDGDDPSHVLYSNIFYCKMQLIKESLEYFGDIFDPEHREDPRKLTLKELLAKTKQERELATKQAKEIELTKSYKNKQQDLNGKNLESKLYYLDTDPNYSIKYLNQAYKEEETKYRSLFSKDYDSSKVSQAPVIDTNRSVGDLVCEWYKTGKMSNGNDIFGISDGGMFGLGFDASAVTNVNGWNLAQSIRFLENNTGMASKHQCAKYVRMALEAGGLSTVGRPQLARQYVSYLPTIGFQHIATLGDNWSSFSFCPGDIAVMQKPGQPSAPGHICMYTGNIWVSDFKQPGGPYVYRSANGGHCGPLWIFRRTGVKAGMFVATTAIGGMANIGTAIAGWGLMSVNGLSFMITCEGWSDWTKRGGIGVPGTDATAGQQAVDRAGIITVGPGLTQYANPAIRQGVRFSARQIMAMWSQTIVKASKDILRRNPYIAKLPQGCKDMAVDCYHSGVGLWIKAGWPSVRTPQDAARACLRMPTGVRGKGKMQGLVDRRSGEAAICLGRRAGGAGARYTNAYYSPNGKIKSLVGK